MVLERYTALSQKQRVRKHREGSIPSHATEMYHPRGGTFNSSPFSFPSVKFDSVAFEEKLD